MSCYFEEIDFDILSSTYETWPPDHEKGLKLDFKFHPPISCRQIKLKNSWSIVGENRRSNHKIFPIKSNHFLKWLQSKITFFLMIAIKSSIKSQIFTWIDYAYKFNNQSNHVNEFCVRQKSGRTVSYRKQGHFWFDWWLMVSTITNHSPILEFVGWFDWQSNNRSHSHQSHTDDLKSQWNQKISMIGDFSITQWLGTKLCLGDQAGRCKPGQCRQAGRVSQNFSIWSGGEISEGEPLHAILVAFEGPNQ